MTDESQAAPVIAKTPGLTTERMAMFTDAVFAITMTLLLDEWPAFLPFSTSLGGGEGIQNPLAVSLFAGALAVLVCCEAAIKAIVVRAGLLRAGADPGNVRRGVGASMTVGRYFVLTAVLSWWVHAIAIARVFAPLAAMVGGRLAGRRRSHTRAG